MSAVSARVSVVPGQSRIGIELPNADRQTVAFKELAESEDFAEAKGNLPMILGKDIAGAPIIADLAAIFADIDTVIAGFVRGQVIVGLFLAVIYGAGLTLVGLNFGLLIGIAAGLMSFVPYFGMLIGLAVAVAIAVIQFGEWQPVVLVLAVFAVGQILESMFLTPKFVGDKVRLHAVWVIFALMVGGALFGFTGILLGIPVAATIGVVVRFATDQYLESALYNGTGDQVSNQAGDSAEDRGDHS